MLRLFWYAFTEALKIGNFKILWFLLPSLSRGAIPLSLQVHWPNIALPSNANLDVPQPLSWAAWAKAIEVGIISTNVLQIYIKDKFVGERGRINCSLRDPSGFWRWLGIQFVLGEKN